MEWKYIIEILGGGPFALMVTGVFIWGWREQKSYKDALDKVDELYERLVEKTNDHLADSIKRETDTLNTLREIAASIRGGRNG